MNGNEWKELSMFLETQCSLDCPKEGYAQGRWQGYQNIYFYFSRVKTKLNFINFVFHLRWMKEIYEEKQTDLANGFLRAYTEILRRLKR